MSHTPAHIRTPPCCLGEHNVYVYRDLLPSPCTAPGCTLTIAAAGTPGILTDDFLVYTPSAG